MSIEELIKEIEIVDYENYKNPKKIKIILGFDSVNKKNRCDEYCKSTEIDVYKSFGEVAFLFENWAFNPSEIFVLGLLLGNLDNATDFLHKISKVSEGYEKFIRYLYYVKGMVLINRKAKSRQFKNIANSYDFIDVLIIGKEPVCKTIVETLKKKNSCVGQIVHCSPKTMNNEPSYFATWFRHDDDVINNVELLRKTSFKKFNITTEKEDTI